MMYLQGYLAPAEGDEDGFPLEQVFCTRKCCLFVTMPSSTRTAHRAGAAGGGGGPEAHCAGDSFTRRQRDWRWRRPGAAAPRVRECREGMGMNFPPKPWEVGWSSVPKRRTLKVLKVQDSDQTYSTRSPQQDHPVSELSESFQFVEMVEIIGFPVQPDAVPQKIFLWHVFSWFWFAPARHCTSAGFLAP